MAVLIISLLAVCLVLLYLEDRRARRERSEFAHVIYVNGIRGKSTVTRMIDAGLRAGGWSVFCKTTGTVPMTIGVDGVERPLVRHGRANINEQLRILHRAAQEGAKILVIECMAVDPALQAVSQERMVRSDIGVITNVRLDHTAEMGPTLEEICDSLSNTIPDHGVLFTADGTYFEQLKRNGQRRSCRVELAVPDSGLPDFDFPENVALALAVCQEVGVARETALEGILHYCPDPYVLSLFRLSEGAVFVNAMSVNDPQSTQLNYHRLSGRPGLSGRRLVLLINNRPDRGYRTGHMVMVAQGLRPEEIWLLGASQQAVRRRLERVLPGTPVHCYQSAAAVPLESRGEDTLIFAAGNLAGPGKDLMERVKQEGTADVL